MSTTERPAPDAARSPGLTYQQLLDTDTHPVPDVLRLESPRYFGSHDLPIDRYTSRAWHELEVERLWSRTWQFACREEHIPEVGDYTIYEIVRRQFIVVRTAPDTVKAYWNSCLHRGRQLKDFDGHCEEIRCPFHNYTWNLDGSLKTVPAGWDFPHVDQRAAGGEFNLPEAKVARWAGFIMINPDEHAPPFEEYAKELIQQFERWNLADRYVQAHVAKVIDCNWKISQEAFCEAYHVNATHPQAVPYLGDTNSQVDVWNHTSRVITPGGTVSPLIWYDIDENTMMRAMLDVRNDEDLSLPVPEGETCRAVSADAARDRWRPIVGDFVEGWSDAEFIDNLDYTLFPNFHPWGAYNRICYRFRPNGDDHRSSIMEVLMLAPFKGERPPPAEVHWLERHEKFTDAPELGMVGKVFNQDLYNMGKVQTGLETSKKGAVTLSNYQESKVRWLHHLLDRYVLGDQAEVRK